jgi:membrane protein
VARIKFIARCRKWVERELLRVPPMLNRIHPPLSRGAGLYDILYFFYQGLASTRFNLAAMAMAYRFFFALFPALILIFTLIPLVPVPDLKPRVLQLMSEIVPQDSLGFVYHIVDEFFAKPSPGIIYLNIALMLFSALSGIKVMMAAFSKEENELFRRRHFLRYNAVALMIFLILLLVFAVLVGSLILIEYWILAWQNAGQADSSGISTVLLRILYWIVLFMAGQVAMSVTYYWGPAMHRRWNFITPGSLTAGVLVLLAINGFRLFFVNFTDYNKVYGSLGAIMLLMVWFYWISIVLLIGFELNAAIDHAGVAKLKANSPDKTNGLGG